MKIFKDNAIITAKKLSKRKMRKTIRKVRKQQLKALENSVVDVRTLKDTVITI